MFCQSCLTSIQAGFESLERGKRFSRILHGSQPDFHGSVVEGCWICRQLWASMLEQDGLFSEHNGNPAEHEDCFVGDFKIPREWGKSRNSSIHLSMYRKKGMAHLTLDPNSHRPLEPDEYRALDPNSPPPLEPDRYRALELILSPTSNHEAEAVPSRGFNIASGTTSAMRNLGLWRRWFRTCSESHGECRQLDHKLQPFWPDRLIEIFTDDNGESFTWKLVHCADVSDVQYLTLSHCWGSSAHTCLTRKNYSDHSKPTASSGLPKSFRDAISITFSLGFHFIWIDSLCIVQDDPKDWKAQASMMGSIYKNSYCNIAATWAKDGNDGCFTTRKYRTIALDSGCGQSRKYDIAPIFVYHDEITNAPSNTRGWVAQERYLARRQLSFAERQVYWECRELVASEQYPAGIPKRLRDLSHYNQTVPPSGKPTLDYTSEADRRKAWVALVEFYSNCNFSHVSDRMIALAGLAEEMRNTTGDVYLAGLWKKDLQSQLCWSTDNGVRRRVDRSTVPTYLAPSWSWANVNGPVISDQNYHRPAFFASSFKILDASIRSEHFSGLHSFVASTLVLRGVAVCARAMPGDDGWVLQPTGLDTNSHDPLTAGIRVSVSWDENMSGSEVNPKRWPNFLEERNSNLLWMFLNIYAGYCSQVHGLILRRLPGAADGVAYVRMGIFRDWDGHLNASLAARLGYPSDHDFVEDIDLDDARLADLVHTVTVI